MVKSKFKKFNFINIVLIGLALIQYYLLTPLNFSSEKYISFAIAADNPIKLIPGFLIFYLSVYILLIFITVLISRKREAGELTVFLFSVVIMWSLVNFFHGIVPVINSIRPEIKNPGFFFEITE